jgi:hypothetical protein
MRATEAVMAHNSIRYLSWLGGVVLLASAAAATLVALVDPYGVYGHGRERRGWNAIKPGLTRYQDEIKMQQALGLSPALLILGNSRAEIGFDPDGAVLRALAPSAYNLAISGSGIAVAHAQLAYLQRIGRSPALVVQGLDFLDFIDAPGRAAVYRAPPPVHAVQRRFWRFDSLYSLTSVQDALQTLLIQHAPDARTSTARGFNPLLEYRAMARREGYYSLFRQRALENARVYLRKAAGRRSGADMAHLEAMLSGAAGAGIDMRLLIYPTHAQILALYEAAGLWPAFEQWKRDLALTVARVRQRDPAARIALVDFSGFGPAACEPIPARGDVASVTLWYWEAGHFKAALGERVLAQLLGNGPAAAGDLGFRLELASLAQNRGRIARQRLACQRAWPALFTDSAALVATARAAAR